MITSIQKNFLFFVFTMISLTSSVYASDYIESSFPDLYARHQIERAGDELVERGFYDEAINKYKEALDPKYIKYEDDKGGAISRITRVLILLQRYDEALHEWQWYLEQSAINAARHNEPNNGEAELKAQEIRARKQYKESGDPKLIYDYIEIYKQKKYKLLPPNFEWGSGPIESAVVFRLYDTIGDYDAGVAFIDEILSFLKKNQAQFGENMKLYDSIRTAQEATTCAELDKKTKQRNSNWRTCNLIREHLLVREGFEKDKQNSGPECKGQKYCIGSATKAIIQSDYFPW